MSSLAFDGVVYRRAAAITPHDTTNIATGPADAVYVGGAGNVVVVFENDSTVTMTAPAGAILPVRAKRVNSTSTTATALVALYATG